MRHLSNIQHITHDCHYLSISILTPWILRHFLHSPPESYGVANPEWTFAIRQIGAVSQLEPQLATGNVALWQDILSRSNDDNNMITMHEIVWPVSSGRKEVQDSEPRGFLWNSCEQSASKGHFVLTQWTNNSCGSGQLFSNWVSIAHARWSLEVAGIPYRCECLFWSTCAQFLVAKKLSLQQNIPQSWLPKSYVSNTHILRSFEDGIPPAWKCSLKQPFWSTAVYALAFPVAARSCKSGQGSSLLWSTFGGTKCSHWAILGGSG